MTEQPRPAPREEPPRADTAVPGPDPRGVGTTAIGVITALLYAAPLSFTQIAMASPARVRMYAALTLADPRTPAPADLATGLRHAREQGPWWLDRDRLRACDTAAQRAYDPAPPTSDAGRVPGWLATARLTGAGIAADVFGDEQRGPQWPA